MSTNVTRRVDPLEDFFRGFFVRPVDFGGGSVANMGTDVPQMRVDVKENAGGYEVHAELPGMKKEDLSVEVTHGYLALSGERKREKEEKKDNFYRNECEYGSFYRAVPLPDGVKLEDVKATFADGVLEVSVPLPAQPAADVRKVQIEAPTTAATSAA